jgi:hypothetical protein
MPYKDPAIKCQKELARRKRKRASDPAWAEHDRAQRRASARRRRGRLGVLADEPRKLKIKTDSIFAAHRRKQKRDAENKRRRRVDVKIARLAEGAAYRANKLHRTPAWADLDAIKLVYLVSEQRTRLSGIEHHVDHFYPLNGKRVSGLHVPLNLRVIPGAENLRKGAQLPA